MHLQANMKIFLSFTVYADDNIPFLTLFFFPLNMSSRLTSEPPFQGYMVSVCQDAPAQMQW